MTEPAEALEPKTTARRLAPGALVAALVAAAVAFLAGSWPLAVLAGVLGFVGGYPRIKSGWQALAADLWRLVGAKKPPPTWLEPATDTSELLKQIAALENDGHLTDAQRADLARLKEKLTERALEGLHQKAARHGIERQPEAVDAEEAAVEALVEAGDPAERQALARIAEGDVAGGLDALEAAAEAATADAVARWRHVGALADAVDTERARAAYARAVALGSRDPWDAIFLARLHRRAGDLGAALATIEAATAALDPTDACTRAALHAEIGDVRRAQGDLQAALDAYQDGLAIHEDLAARDPANTEWQRDLSVSWDRLGDVRRSQGDLPGALRAYQDGRVIAQDLAARDPANTKWQRDLFVSLNKLGDVRLSQGDLLGALRAYEDGLAIAQDLARHDPANTEWQRDLSVSWNRIGDMRRSQGDLEGALRAYQDGLAIRQTLAARDPANAVWRLGVAMNLGKLALLDGSGVGWGAVADAFEAMDRDGVLAPVDRPYLDEARRLAGRTDD